MKAFKQLFFCTAAGILTLPSFIFGMQLNLHHTDEESVIVGVNSSDKFADVMESLSTYYGQAQGESAEAAPVTLSFTFSHDQILVRKKTSFRDYSVPVSKSEKKDLSYIIRSLANDSLASIALSTSSINKAGDRIDHLHPLRFLMTIFTDEELKAGAHAIKDRGGLVWDGFMAGVIRGSTEETAKGNMKEEDINDFAQKVKIDPKLILGAIQNSRWKDLVNILIDKIPRDKDPNRYDM